MHAGNVARDMPNVKSLISNLPIDVCLRTGKFYKVSYLTLLKVRPRSGGCLLVVSPPTG